MFCFTILRLLVATEEYIPSFLPVSSKYDMWSRVPGCVLLLILAIPLHSGNLNSLTRDSLICLHSGRSDDIVSASEWSECAYAIVANHVTTNLPETRASETRTILFDSGAPGPRKDDPGPRKNDLGSRQNDRQVKRGPSEFNDQTTLVYPGDVIAVTGTTTVLAFSNGTDWLARSHSPLVSGVLKNSLVFVVCSDQLCSKAYKSHGISSQTDQDFDPRAVIQMPEKGLTKISLRQLVSAHSSQSWSVAVLGDWGAFKEYADIVSKSVEQRKPAIDLVALIGDNLYEIGTEHPMDKLFVRAGESFSEFSKPENHVPFIACLGNHDYLLDPLSQVLHGLYQAQTLHETSAGADHNLLNWHMPYYYHYSVLTNSLVCMIFLDTDNLTPRQLKWFQRTLESQECYSARFIVVNGHHPVYTAGSYRSIQTVRRLIEPFLKEYAVEIYTAGHNHDMELIVSGDTTYVVSGAAGKQYTSGPSILREPAQVKYYADGISGYAVLDVESRSDSLKITFYSVNSKTSVTSVAFEASAVSNSLMRGKREALMSGTGPSASSEIGNGVSLSISQSGTVRTWMVSQTHLAVSGLVLAVFASALLGNLLGSLCKRFRFKHTRLDSG